MEINDISKFFSTDPFTSDLGFEIKFLTEFECNVEVNIKDKYLNRVGIVHGGFLFTLCDFTSAVLANSYGEESLSIDSSISYLNKCRSRKLYATAKYINRSNRLFNIEVEIKDDSGVKIALSKCLFYITPKKISFK